MHRYRRGEAFSLHLAASVSGLLPGAIQAMLLTRVCAQALREADYTTALGQLGWLRPAQIEEEATLLDRAIARYHGFMDLIAANPRLISVPTVDIVRNMVDIPRPLFSHADDGLQELAWQTHLLKSSYFADMKNEVGRYVDHDAAIEESALAQLFADTTEAWNVRCLRWLSNGIAVELTPQSE